RKAKDCILGNIMTMAKKRSCHFRFVNKLLVSFLLMTVCLSPVLAEDTSPTNFYISRADHLYYSGLVSGPVENPSLEINNLTSALSKNPRNVKAYYNRATIKMQNRDPAGAKEDFVKAFYGWPTTPEEYADSCLLKWVVRAPLDAVFKDCEE